MRQKELRIALVCYGGVSLAIYMHGVTKEVWHLARASRDFHTDAPPSGGVSSIYREMLEQVERAHGLRLRVLPDIVTGASGAQLFRDAVRCPDGGGRGRSQRAAPPARPSA